MVGGVLFSGGYKGGIFLTEVSRGEGVMGERELRMEVGGCRYGPRAEAPRHPDADA